MGGRIRHPCGASVGRDATADCRRHGPFSPRCSTLSGPVSNGGASLPDTKAGGDVVAILGPGIRGICAAVAAKEAGAAFVAMTGVGPRDEQRLAIARSFGVDLPIDVSKDDAATALQRETGGRLADVVVDVTAKAPTAFADAVGLARPGGTVVVAGTRGGGGAPRFEPDLLVYKELHVVGALGVEYPAYRAALEILAMGRWPFDRITRESTGFAGLAQLLTSLADESARSSGGALHNVFFCPRPNGVQRFNREGHP